MGARVLISIALALVACEKVSKKWCENHPGDLENCGYLDAMIDSRPTCSADPDCQPAAPYCELNAHFCVECYLPEHCAGNPVKKFCDLDTFLCTSCVSNSDCASNVCLPTGVCGDDSNVAYVDSMGTDNTVCTMVMPCDTVAAALLTGRPFIKLKGTIDEAVVIDGLAVSLIADAGATLTNTGIVLTIKAGADVAVYDLTIIGGNEKGIFVEAASTARLTRVTVTNCNAHDKEAIEVKNSTLLMTRSAVLSNIGGGVSTDAGSIYQITNSFIYRNGADDSNFGGASLSSTSSAFNRFEMNTVIDNRAEATALVGGVKCSAAIAAPNNVVARNFVAGSSQLAEYNTGTGLGGCNFSQSLIATDLEQLALVQPDVAPFDYHLTAGSTAIDRGVMSDVTLDFDGDTRPQGTKVDFGADEFKQ